MIARFIPHAKAAAYAKRGWAILVIRGADGKPSHHAAHAVCAVRKAKRRKVKESGAR